MSEPTQQDRERAKEWAQLVIHDDGLGLIGPEPSNAASVLLALLAEREATPSDSFYATRSLIWATKAHASGRRAGLLELAEWLETSRGGLDPLPEPRAYYEGQRDVLGNVASRARAMVSEQPRTPSRMDDPDE